MGKDVPNSGGEIANVARISVEEVVQLALVRGINSVIDEAIENITSVCTANVRDNAKRSSRIKDWSRCALIQTANVKKALKC